MRAAAQNRCGYCLSRQHLVLGRLQIEHLLPRCRGGLTEESNLWLSCALCNNYSVPTKAVERVQDALAVRLASLRLPTT